MKTNCMKKAITSLLIIIALFVSSTSLLFAAKKSSKKNSTSFIGKWVFHSIQNMNPNAEPKFVTAEELLNQIPEHIENDVRAMAEFNMLIHSFVEISKDGNLYLLSPIPEGELIKEVDEAVAAGVITLRNGMIMLDKPTPWQDRNGELWIQTGIEKLPDGTEEPSWEKSEIMDNILTIAIFRYQKV